MVSVNFYLKNPSIDKETSIFMQVCYNNRKFKYYISERIHPKFWENDKEKDNFQRAKRTKSFSEYSEFNARLDDIETRTKDIFRRYQNDNKQIPDEQTFKHLLDLEFSNKMAAKRDFWTFFDQLISGSKSGLRTHPKTGKLISKNTIKTYNTTYKHLKAFELQYKRKIDFDKIDLELYKDFTEYLQQKDIRLSNNSVGKNIQVLKTILNEAVEEKWTNNIAHKSKRFVTKRELTDSIYLNETELTALVSLDLSANPKLDKVRDLFIIGCYTGLRYSDWSSIKPNAITDNELEIATIKTGEVVVIPLHPRVKDILNKYKGELPEVISNQKMNEYLKDIGKLMPLLSVKTEKTVTKGGTSLTTNFEKWRLLSTHTARRSFATNLYIQKFPAFSIMKITGHKTERAFLRYIRITPNESAKLLALHWQNNTPNLSVNTA